MSNKNKILELLRRAQSLFKDREYEKAADIANQVLALDSQNAEAYYIRGYHEDPARSKTKELDFRKALSIDPSHGPAHLELAKLYANSLFEKYNYEEAEKIYTEIIKKFPRYAEAYKYRGKFYNKNRHYDLAEADLTEAIKLISNDANLYAARGKVSLNKKNYEETLSDLSKAFALDSGNFRALQLLLSALDKKPDFLDFNDVDEIAEQYEEKIAANRQSSLYSTREPALASIYTKLGEFYANKKDHEKTIDRLKKSIKYSALSTLGIPSGSPEVHCLLGHAYSGLGQYKEAIVEFDKAVDHPGAALGRSKALIMLIEKQKEDFQERIEEFLAGPNSIFELQEFFLKREKEYGSHYNNINRWIIISLGTVFFFIIGGVLFVNEFLFSLNPTSGKTNVLAFLPYFGIIFLIISVPIWWTRILLKSRDRWKILQEDCFRKACIMQYIKATGRDEEFRNKMIYETIQHMANRSGADLLVALHSEDTGMLYSATDMIEKISRKKSS